MKILISLTILIDFWLANEEKEIHLIDQCLPALQRKSNFEPIII